MKKWFRNLLKRIEEANKKNFGAERMDCCNINKERNQKKK
jgi:hypothetical protein